MSKDEASNLYFDKLSTNGFLFPSKAFPLQMSSHIKCHRTATGSARKRGYKIATALIHPALARSIFTGKQLSIKPNGGSAAKLVSFSIW
jgi:hypothetical protein